MCSLLAAASACLALIVAAPAMAATPFTAGTGAGHDIAVGSDGTAHVAWLNEEGSDERVQYCRIPAGGSACDAASQFLDFSGAASDALGQVQVFAPEVGMIVILAGCTQCTGVSELAFRWISTNNGSMFGSPGQVGEMRFGGQGSYIGGGNVLGVNGGLFQAMASTVDPINLGGSYVYSPSAARGSPPGSEAVYAANNLAGVKYNVFNATTDPDDMNDLAAPNWGADRFLSSPEADNEETHLSDGANGVLLSYHSSFSPSDSRVGLRSFDSATDVFGAPTYIDGASPIDNNGLDFPHHSQDPSGRIHAVWRTLHDGGRLRYVRSEGGAAPFSAPANLATGESFQNPLVEAGPTGSGFAAWNTTGSAIRVVPIDPQPEPSVPGGGTGDITSPGVSGFSAGDTTLRPGQGTSFRFNSNEAGLAVLTVQKRVKGLKIRSKGKLRCLVQTKRRLRSLRRSLARGRSVRRLRGRAKTRSLARLLRKRRCSAYKKVGEIRQAVVAGRNTIVFSGRIAGRRLGAGRYRARLVVTDAAGNVSRVETLNFRVLPQRKRSRAAVVDVSRRLEQARFFLEREDAVEAVGA